MLLIIDDDIASCYSLLLLLGVLQDQTFEVLGDSRPRKVDGWVLSATNADPATVVQEHTFRENLFLSDQSDTDTPATASRAA